MATIEIDGKEFEVDNGKMIIEVADEAGIKIPRFCYHKKLSVAANCRMCLVEIENGRKPVPACATPITDGMKVYTKSEEAIRSQKAVMEFLLINHPLDCPICDQGGECELQDVSMGYGEGESDYLETKRSFDDDDLGALISTEMTRCIHCTRCVRFGDEIAGMRELGATGRGEATQIGTFVKHSIKSEVSGNVIDLCPVGALTSKPYRFNARAWELQQHESIAPHDCLGSNVYVHTRRNEVMRVVPRENESINETWLSDSDRFSYLGLKSEKRLSEPMIKQNGQWQTTDWSTALNYAVEGIKKIIDAHGGEQVAAFASSSSTLEELYLLQKLMRDIGVNNVDHRLHQSDFRDQTQQDLCPASDGVYADIDKQQAILLIGTHLHREVPLAAVRVRKAFLNGATVMAVNAIDYEFPFDCAHKMLSSPVELSLSLAKIAQALVQLNNSELSQQAQKLLLGVEADEQAKAIAQKLNDGGMIISGAIVENHPEAATLHCLVDLIKQLAGVKQIRLTEGANSAGAWIAGMVPHRQSMGQAIEQQGLNAVDAIANRLKAYVLMGVEPGYDFVDSYQSRQAMLAAEFVVCLSAFNNDSINDYADVILPIAPFTETSGTYINHELVWQSVKGVSQPYGQSRPAWKILRVLGNLFDCAGFDYTASDEILAELKTAYDLMQPLNSQTYYPEQLIAKTDNGMLRFGEWSVYQVDAITRNAQALQRCGANESACIRVNPETAQRLKLNEVATVSQGDIEITLPLKRDDRIAPDVVAVANALPETADLSHSFAPITIKR